MDIGTKALPLSLSQIVLQEISTKKKYFYVVVANLSLSQISLLEQKIIIIISLLFSIICNNLH